MKLTIMRFAAFATVASFAGAASAFTLITFADPSSGPANPLFNFSGGIGNTGQLTGGWMTTGLFLQTPGLGAPDFVDAKFTVRDPINVVNGLAGAGNIDFFDSTNNPLFTISFSSASYNVTSFGGAELVGNDINFSGPIIPGGLDQFAFAFAFANQTLVGNELQMTSSFTSSAVPEPATMTALGLGLAAVVARRRRK